jgi:hypothetical protein
MKKTATFLFIAASACALSQEIKVKEGSGSFSSGSNNALVTTVYERSKDDVMSEWKSKLNNFKDEKVSRKGDEIFGDNILIKDWGNNPVDIYTKFEEDKDKKTITMSLAVDLGGTYLKSSGDKDKYQYMEKLMKEFAVKMTKDGIEDKVKEASNALSKLESNQKDLESKNSSLKKDIENYKDKIKKAEDDVKANDADQVKKKAEIEAQKKVVDEIKKKLNSVN